MLKIGSKLTLNGFEYEVQETKKCNLTVKAVSVAAEQMVAGLVGDEQEVMEQAFREIYGGPEVAYKYREYGFEVTLNKS